ncbi:MAG: Crp/Fnr family transcriptional regulator [Micrococcales bacterium]|nr:Crp/Fnr family transcriptional regulator [Micrococcales bacterium]
MDSKIIRSAGLFGGLSEDAATSLLAAMTPMRLARGQVLFRHGETGDRLYLIQTAKIKLGTPSPDGRENLLAVLGPGEMVGELTLFDPGPRTATATAVMAGKVLELSHAGMVAWLSQNPTAARQLLAEMAGRLRRTNDALSDMIFTDAPGRIAKTLIDLAERFGEPTDHGIQVTHGLTQEELAQLVGASRETVNKALNGFVARGWIRLEGRGCVLLNLEQLGQRAR